MLTPAASNDDSLIGNDLATPKGLPDSEQTARRSQDAWSPHIGKDLQGSLSDIPLLRDASDQHLRKR